MGKRRRARELALQYLYQWDFHGREEAEAGDLFWESRREGEKVISFAREIVEGVKAHKEEIDRLIEAHSRNWKLYRMSRVDRNILRIAVYELLCCPDIPPKVSIDEAIEVGKKFGTTESGAFVNGILDQVCRYVGKLEPGEDQNRQANNDHTSDSDSL